MKLAEKLKERRETQEKKLAAQQEKEREQFIKRADKSTSAADVGEVCAHFIPIFTFDNIGRSKKQSLDPPPPPPWLQKCVTFMLDAIRLEPATENRGHATVWNCVKFMMMPIHILSVVI